MRSAPAGDRAGLLRRLAPWYPAVVFVLAVVALMPSALAGRATYVAVDLNETTSPYRDDLDRAPVVVSPTQTDQVEQTPPVLRFMDRLEERDWQLWEPRIGGGTPTATTFPWLTSPFNVVYFVAPGWYAATLDVALTLLVGQLLLYLLVRRLGASRAAATFGAVAYAFTGTNMVFLQRPLSAVWILPGLLWAAHRMVDRPTVPRGLAVGGFVAWCWFEGFPSVFAYSMYTAIAWVAWLVVRRWQRERALGEAPLDAARDGLRRLAATGAAFVWGAALAGVTLVPFVHEVQDRGLLDLRRTDLHSHLPGFYLWSLFDLRVNGDPLDPGTVWGGVTPYESVTMVGSIVLVAAFAGLVAAGLGRLRLRAPARDAWAFFAVVPVIVALLSFVGTRVLGWAYLVPGIESNPLHRSRFLIALGLTVLATLHVDRLLTGRGAEGERAPRAAALVVLAGWLALGAVTADDLWREAREAGQSGAIAGGILIGAGFAAAAGALVWLARRGRLAPALAGIGLAVLVYVQVPYPLRDFTPEAPVADFYRETDGHRALERLGEGRYRFAATTFNYYPGSAALMDLYDLRGLVLYDQPMRALLERANPTVFARDPLKQQLFPDEVHLESPVYDHLALRHFVLSTGELPYGEIVDPDIGPPRWEPVGGSPLEVEVQLPPGRELAGAGFRLRHGAGCDAAQLRFELVQDGRIVDVATKPAYDAPADWVTVALTGRALSGPTATVRLVPPPGCELDVGMDEPDALPPLRLVLDDPTDAVRLVESEQGWIYERPTAWPLVSVHPSWRWFPDQRALLEALPARTDGSTPPVGLVGEGAEVAGSGPATVEDVDFGHDGVSATVHSEGPALLVVSQRGSDGWEATVDGVEAEVESVDGALLGVRVPAGTSVVDFTYEPSSVRVGLAVTALAALLGAASLLVVARRGRPGAAA